VTSSVQGGVGAGRGRSTGGPNAIVGRVLDSAGKPVPGTFVTALSPEPRAGRPFSVVSAILRSVTDERGEFRLDGLRLGEFYVIALPHNAPLDGRQLSRSGYGNTFHPGATNLPHATLVRVTTSGPARADITLAPARLSAMSGTVIGESGRPVSGGILRVAHGDGLFGLDSRAVPIRPNGSFVVAALQPGSYHLHFRESTWPPPPGEIPLVSVTKVVVAEADVPNVRGAPVHMVRATGRVVVDAARRQALQPSLIQIVASPIDFDGNPGPSQPGTVREDLTFEFMMWPAAGTIRVRLPAQAWAVKAVRLNSIDVTDKPIDFVAGKDISGLEIELIARR
jgi:hypothetical protein